MAVLELGVEYGNSILAIVELVKQYHGQIIAIDHWIDERIFCEFLARTNAYYDAIRSYRVNLFSFDQVLMGGIFDLIHFDACYTYPEVKLMIQRYLSKVKNGGIICGHGADFYWGQLSKDAQEYYKIFPEQVEVGIEADSELAKLIFVPFKSEKRVRIHTNLARALYEIFNDDYHINGKHTYWSKVIN